MAVQVTGPIDELLADVWRSVSGIDDGEVATYIPELAKADPATFGMGLATLDGQVYVAGELVPFTIQSVSKPFVYALALADRGHADVLAKVGTEPTGDPFNSISIDEATGRASNPMVNAGAIVTSSLVRGASRADQLERVLGGLSAFAGREKPRSTRISALEPTICHVLSPAAYAALQAEAPVACAELTLAIARSLSQRLRYSTADVAAFEET